MGAGDNRKQRKEWDLEWLLSQWPSTEKQLPRVTLWYLVQYSIRSMFHKSEKEYSCWNTEQCLHIEPYIHLTTTIQEKEGKKNMLNSTTGMKPAKPRLWENPEDEWSSFFNKYKNYKKKFKRTSTD